MMGKARAARVAGSVRAVGKGEGSKQVRTQFHIRFRSKSY